MTTPPSTGPSPTPSSSSSSNIHQTFSMSHINQLEPGRAPSATSHASANSASGREKPPSGVGITNGSAPGEAVSDSTYEDHPHSQSHTPSYPSHAPMPMTNPGGPFPNTNPTAYLPPVTSSPPPHVPTYVPPPQHAMAPDPIHDGGGPSMMSTWPGSQVPQWRPPGTGVSQSSSYGGQQQPPHPRHMGLNPNGVMPGQAHGPGTPVQVAPEGFAYPHPRGGGGFGQQGMMGLGGFGGGYGGRPGSAHSHGGHGHGHGHGHGDGRDRRRDRDRDRDRQRDDDRDGERDSREDEVISTIFVVGFPDDMSEREFQNIFTFSPGFEAATMKFPSGSSRREPTAALLAELSQIAANQQAAAAAAAASGGEPYEPPPGQPALEEALAALQMGGTASTSSSTTPSAAMSMTPSAPSGATFGSSALPQLPSRRQTIGFARFRTRADAIAAKEHLQGRKIDMLTGATLKAEMAKKNLHQKRATSGEELVGLLLRSGRLANLVNASGGPGSGHPIGAMAMGGGQAQAPGQGMMLPPPVPPVSQGPGMSNGLLLHQQQGPQPPSSARDAWNSWSSQPQQPQQLGTEMPGGAAPSTGNTTQQPPSSQSQSNPSTSPPSSVKSPNARPTDSKALLALAEEADELDGGSWPLGAGTGDMSMGMNYGMGLSGMGVGGMSMGLDGFMNPGSATSGYPHNPHSNPNLNNGDASGPGQNQQQQARQRVRTSTISSNQGDHSTFQPPGQQGQAGGMRPSNVQQPYRQFSRGSVSAGDGMNMAGSPPGGSDRLSESGGGGGMGRGVGGNPADQNPPINTLYVGNLPAISPPTHPPNFLEESLRALFARSPGYKRMSFRQKINGPMCFVEFEDIPFASQAIKDLYGHNLGGLVKGGIRLSYSKNSLGQRGNSHGSANTSSMFGGIAHTVALAGMSPSSTHQHLANNPGGGAGLGGMNSNNSNAFGLQLQGAPGQGPSPSMISPTSASGGHSLPIPGGGGGGGSGGSGERSEGTSLSPTAQPFTASSLSTTTSPRSRYFGSSPSAQSQSGQTGPGGPGPDQPGAYPYPGNIGSGGGAQPVGIPTNDRSNSVGAGAGAGTGVGSGSGSGSGGQFSPVSSPIRTPASFSWVSSSGNGGGGAGIGNGGYGFDGFSPNSTGGGMSFSGAANAWSNGGGGGGLQMQ